MKKIANAIPHHYRVQILLIWLPLARVSMADEYYKNLFEAYFIYVDPNGIRKTNCPRCLQNIYNNWKSLQPHLVEAEREYNLIESL